MRIIILYEHIVRELDAVKRLCAVLREKGHECVYFSGDFEMTKAYAYAKKHKVDAILMPWFVDDEHFDLIFPILRANPSIKVVNLHHEQISSKVYESVLFPQSKLTQANSYHFAWGSYFAEQLISRGTSPDRVFITGNIRNDKAFQIEKSRTELASQFKLDSDKKWILFAENRGFANQRMNESMKQALRDRGLTDDEIEESAKNSADSLHEFFQILQNLPRAFLDKYEFIYRPHPGTQAKVSFPKGVHLISELPIYEWMANCNLFVTCESTSIFEAEVCGIPCVTYNNLPAPDKFRMAGVDRYPKLNALTEIDDELIERVRKEQQDKHIYQDYLGLVDGEAVYRAADAVERIAESDGVINFFDHKYPVKMMVRRYLYEKATWVSVKTGLLDKIKFPNSSYWSSRDIPYSKKNTNLYFSDTI